MNAVIYARVSTEEQAERGTSIQAQLIACRDYAEKKKYRIVGEFVDDCTGTTLDRPGLNDLQDALDKEKAKVVIVFTDDRLSRNYPNTVIMKSLWAERGIEIHFTDRGKEEHTLDGMIVSAFKEISAHNEVNTFVRRAIQGRDDKVSIKKKMVMNGNPPYGYEKIMGGADTKIAICKEDALTVQNIFEMYTGKNGHSNPMSLKAVARHLNKTGILPPSKNSDQKWCPVKIHRILTNEIYIGIYWWGKSRMVRKGFQQKGVRVKQPREKWISLDVPELKIIDTETFHAAQEQVKRNKILAKRNKKYKYLLSGFLFCGECGTRMCGHHMKSGLYYRCSSEYKKYTSGDVCEAVGLRVKVEKVDEVVWGWIKQLLCETKTLESGLEEMNKANKKGIQPKQERLRVLTDLITEGEKKILRLIKELAKIDDDDVLDVIREEIQRIKNNSGVLTSERIRLEDELSRVEISVDQKNYIMSFASEITHKLDHSGFDEKRRIMDMLDVRVVLFTDEKPRRIEISCAITPDRCAIELHQSLL